ncbi:hypothetical protein BPNPMPFG_003293 [Mesorhizobium sp. AR07]|nr:hypothetical protein [Mesorhizobium sp. AR07]UVK47511.1 hypothetical protein BPNPMPFG_003293 [Mesorhizobium sp. AR07]
MITDLNVVAGAEISVKNPEAVVQTVFGSVPILAERRLEPDDFQNVSNGD